MKHTHTILFALLCTLQLQAQFDCTEYTEVDGLVIIEAEHTKSNLGQWIVKTDVPDYKGSGHLEFTGNETRGGSPKSPLTYTFQINKTAYYRVLLRSRKRIAPGDTSHKSNDCFIRVSGNFDASPNAEERNYGDASLETLQKDVKIYGGNLNDWGKAFTLDLGGHNRKRVPVYGFKAGETYTLTISGRSKQFNVDRIIFYQNGKYNLNQDKIDIFDATPETVCKIPTLSNTSQITDSPQSFVIHNSLKNKQLSIIKNHNQPQLFRIYTIQGELIQTFASNTTTTAINLSSFSPGIYLLQGEKAVQKFVVPL